MPLPGVSAELPFCRAGHAGPNCPCHLHPQKQKKNDNAINKIMEDLDTNGDKELNFEEFSILVARLTVASHEEMHKNAPEERATAMGQALGRAARATATATVAMATATATNQEAAHLGPQRGLTALAGGQNKVFLQASTLSASSTARL